MSSFEVLSETRDIKGISRIVLRDYGQLFIKQGEDEGLRIEGHRDLLHRVKSTIRGNELILDMEGGWFDKAWRTLTSSFEGKSLKYYLTTKKLDGVFVSGAGRIKMQGLKSDNLYLILKGAGEIMISELELDRLEVDLPGAGVISVSGNTTSQQVKLTGAGSFDAPRLKSKEGSVSLKGVGKASVWVTEKLDAKVDGVGSIDYYGDPVVRRKISGLGSIEHRRT